MILIITQLGYLLRGLNAKHKEKSEHVKAHVYATPGHTVEDDLADQLTAFFEQFPQKSGPDGAPPLDPNTTLYGDPKH